MRFEHAGLLTARPFNGAGYSVERQHSAGCALANPHRRWHVLSYFPEDGAAMTRAGAWGEAAATALKGRLGLYPAGEAETASWRGAQVEALHVHIAPERIAQASLETRGAPFANVQRRFLFADPVLEGLCGGLYELARNRPDAETDAEALIAAIAERIAEIAAQPGAPFRPRIGHLSSASLLDRMHGAPALDASVDALAEEAGLSRRAFFRRFASVCGASPHDHLIRSRLEYAKAFLQRGAALSEVALDAGFYDQAHFTRAFSARIGLAPGRYQDLFAAR
ncbi:MAG: helix-turn-helix domain-containing protein [Oceanicaulis sp.]